MTARYSITAIPWGSPTSRRCRRRTPWAWTTFRSTPTRRGRDGTVTVSLDKIQRSGVRTEKVGTKIIARAGARGRTVEHDESLLTIITVRSDGYIEDLFVDKTGQHVETGQPLFRFYSPQIQLAQVDLLVALRAQGRDGGRDVENAVQKLRNLDVPEARIEEVRRTKENPRTLDWPSPTTGDVTAKSIIKGQFVKAATSCSASPITRAFGSSPRWPRPTLATSPWARPLRSRCAPFPMNPTRERSPSSIRR